MELKLQIGVFMLFIHVSLAELQHMTVMKGQTITLKCPVTNTDDAVEWKNPEGHHMYFGHKKGEGVQDKRYNLVHRTESEFTVSISDATFKDGGTYTCSQYAHPPIEKKVEVTVLGVPKISKVKHDGMFVIKCTAGGNHHPPQISWQLDQGPEILSHSQVHHEGNVYVSTDDLHIFSVETRVTVKCLVRHPAWKKSRPQMNFIKFGRVPANVMTTTRPPTPQPQGSTEVPRTTTHWIRHGSTTAYLITKDISSTSALSDSTRTWNESVSNETSTTGWTSVPETIEETTLNNNTHGNKTGQVQPRGSSSILVLLVTCLIVALLIVVIFFAIKLRKAHIAWKKENEDSVPSEESSKSKSSQEEKNSKGQRRRGINTAFTSYAAEQPVVITSVINTGAMMAAESTNTDQMSQPQTQAQTAARSNIKETEL